MVVDDLADYVYVGEEDVGIWRFPLSPEADPPATLIDAIPSACLPRDDVEGLAIVDDGEARCLRATTAPRSIVWRERMCHPASRRSR
jgi:myo-inositol-hexaphosphate 3-phosphohydrolase